MPRDWSNRVPHRWHVLDELIEQQGWCSRSEIGLAPGLPDQTIGYALRDLIKGRVVEVDTDLRSLPGKAGSTQTRPVTVYRAMVRRIRE